MDIQQYLNRYFIRKEDSTLILELWDSLEPEMNGFIDSFYDWLVEIRPTSEFKDIYKGDEKLRERKDAAYKHWKSFFHEERNDQYLEKRTAVGIRNAKSGGSTELYFEGLLKVYDLFREIMLKIGSKSDAVFAFSKFFMMDMSIVIDAQNQYIREQLQEQNEALKEMSTPITQLYENLLFVPLVGIIDSRRAYNLMNIILQKISSTQAKVFIIDIGGIAVMDTAVANSLVKITKATQLMGCKVILSGISSTVAQTIVELGVVTGNLVTTGNLQAALHKGLALLGAEITKKE